MNQYLAAGVVLIVISLTGLSYVAVTVSLYPEQAIIFKSTFAWFLLQCSASVFCGILGGYFIGVHRKTQEPNRAQDS
jgi:hypothetical protein